MKKMIFLFLVSFQVFSQQQIDTNQVQLIREEWEIEDNNSDSTLTEILTQYKNGIFKQHSPSIEYNSEYGFYSIYEYDSLNQKKFYIQALNNILIKNFYNSKGDLKSVVSYVNGEQYQKKIKNNYSKDLLLESKDDFKRKEYLYDSNSNLIEIKTFKDSTLIGEEKISGNRIIYRKTPEEEVRFKYDSQNRLIFESSFFSDIKYEYNNFGLAKKIIFFKNTNSINEQDIYIYDKKGNLIERKIEYPHNDKMVIRSKYKYNYHNGT